MDRWMLHIVLGRVCGGKSLCRTLQVFSSLTLKRITRSTEYQPLAASETTERDDDAQPSSSRTHLVPRRVEESEDAEEDLPPLNVRQTAELAFAFCLLWFIANWSVNASLDYTTVASATILASTSGEYSCLSWNGQMY